MRLSARPDCGSIRSMDEPAELLTSERVELRQWRVSDLDALDRAIRESRDHLLPWMPWAADHSRRNTAEFLARKREEWTTGQTYDYAIRVDSTVVGSCGLMRRIGAGGLEIGYWLHPRWCGQGVATTAVRLLVGQGFRLVDVDRIEIHHDAANSASGAVARRAGFTEVARAEKSEGPAAPGEVGIEVVWRMTADEWADGEFR